MMKKDGHKMEADYDDLMQVKMLLYKKELYIRLDDIIKWLRYNKDSADNIETEWLIKVFVRLKNSAKQKV